MKVLAAVYNQIDYDGRVQRAAAALSAIGEVTVLSLDSGRVYSDQRFGVEAVHLPPTKRPKILNHLRFWFAMWRKALTWRPDVIYAHDFFLAFPGWVAAKLSKARLVYDAHELIIPEEGVVLSRRDLLWYVLERWSIPRADLVIAANEERARFMAQHYALKSLPLVIRNIPPQPTRTMKDHEVQERYPQLKRKSNDECLVVYQGDVSLERGLGSFVEAVQRLPEKFRLVLIGTGPDLETLQESVGKGCLDGKISFTGRVPRSHLHDLLCQCDIGIVTYASTGLNNLYCAPNKIYEYAQSGLAVICSSNPVLDGLIARHPIGTSVARGADVAATLGGMSPRLAAYKSALHRFLDDSSWDQEAVRLLAGISAMSQ